MGRARDRRVGTAALTVALGYLVASTTFGSARTLVHCGTLIDGVANAPKKEMTVIVDGQRMADDDTLINSRESACRCSVPEAHMRFAIVGF